MNGPTWTQEDQERLEQQEQAEEAQRRAAEADLLSDEYEDNPYDRSV